MKDELKRDLKTRVLYLWDWFHYWNRDLCQCCHHRTNSRKRNYHCHCHCHCRDSCYLKWLSSAQLAAAHPVSGEYANRFLNSYFGFTAGWMFLIANKIIVSVTLLGLAALVAVGFISEGIRAQLIADAFTDTSGSSILYASALMFVAYTGYGRIATLGEEVDQPELLSRKPLYSPWCLS